MQSVYYVGLDVHKKTISYCVKYASGRIHLEDQDLATTKRVVVRPQRQNVLAVG
jgi:hypothetical protein